MTKKPIRLNISNALNRVLNEFARLNSLMPNPSTAELIRLGFYTLGRNVQRLFISTTLDKFSDLDLKLNDICQEYREREREKKYFFHPLFFMFST